MIEENIRKFAKENFIPIIRPKTLDLLINKVREVNPKVILEIGTAIGYSGIKMLENSNAKLITLEKDENMKNLALQNFEKENLIDRVNLIYGDAFEFISTMTQKFDFIFLDGPKSQYIKYLPYLINALPEKGVIFCDDVYFHNLVNNEKEPPKKFRTIVNSLRKFLNEIQNDKNLEVEVLDLEDGVAIIKKIKNNI